MPVPASAASMGSFTQPAAGAAASTAGGSEQTGRRSRYGAQEQEIRQWAIDFDNAEAQKEVKWETNRGDAVPTDAEVGAVMQRRAELREAREAARQRESCQRGTAQRDAADRVVVVLPTPGAAQRQQFKDPRFDSDGPRAFDPSPADRVHSRRRLLDVVVQAGRSFLHRSRAQRRLRNAKDARQGRVGVAAADAAIGNCDVYFSKVVVPTSSIVRQREGVSQPEPVSADRQFADPIPLKDPFAFQVKAYRPHPFPEHPLLNADAPATPVLHPPGTAEVPEVQMQGELQRADATSFAEPVPSQAHFPTEGFCFRPPCESVFYPYGMRQEETDAGAREPYRDYSCFDQNVSSTLNRTHRSSGALNSSLAPALMTCAIAEDKMSDTEDETSAALPQTHPKGLAEVAAWLAQVTQMEVDPISSLPIVCDPEGDADDPTASGDEDWEAVEGVSKCTVLPVHSHDSVITNALVAERLSRFADIEDRVRACLPQSLHKLF
eukprot:TRINITY_DN46905_c0_g1_i1.p1 TRINITY_DN46905_c0_g1~~TRINITY_DN46905_c0_g1_i1.p1  ORF type:complete len:512 (+),score=182.51 TRINITY_DN46905_c0_g1_i1:60-1538(+)